jgi:hypothetical protein
MIHSDGTSVTQVVHQVHEHCAISCQGMAMQYKLLVGGGCLPSSEGQRVRM